MSTFDSGELYGLLVLLICAINLTITLLLSLVLILSYLSFIKVPKDSWDKMGDSYFTGKKTR